MPGLRLGPVLRKEAVTGFLRNAASVQPLVLVLEDLHWADRGTLDLLQQLREQIPPLA